MFNRFYKTLSNIDPNRFTIEEIANLLHWFALLILKTAVRRSEFAKMMITHIICAHV